MQTVKVGEAAIPALGFGVFRMSGAEVKQMVPHALAAGFRHFDTAQIYGNEAELGFALANGGIPRSELFVTTKIWVTNYASNRFASSLDESLEKLQTDYVDLLLLHWPSKVVSLSEQLASLDAARAAGKARFVGVSNFTIAMVDECRQLAQSPITTNQVECHPYLDQSKLINAMQAMDVAVTAYYAMADGRVMSNAVLKDIGRKHGKSAAQVVLRWLVQLGLIALTKTVHPSRAMENAAIFDFALDAQEMERIHHLARMDGRLVSPPGLAPAWDR
jgi:diketogulonate reductase-like aldo/keto reductase